MRQDEEPESDWNLERSCPGPRGNGSRVLGDEGVELGLLRLVSLRFLC